MSVRRSAFLPRRTAPARSRTQIHLSRGERATSGHLTLTPVKTSRHNNLSVSCPLRYDKETDFCGSLSLPFTIRTYDQEDLRNDLGKIFDFFMSMLLKGQFSFPRRSFRASSRCFSTVRTESPSLSAISLFESSSSLLIFNILER